MNKILVAFVFAILNLSASAQYVVFSENMGNTSVGTSELSARTYTGFQNYNQNGIIYNADLGSTATVRSNTSSSTGYPSASGGNFVNVSGNASAFFSINNIPISLATGIQLSFGVSKTLIAEDGSNLVIEVSVDGAAPLSFSPVLATGSGTTNWYYITSPLTIPAGSLLSINFRNISNATNSVSFRIDDILITSLTPLPVSFGGLIAAQKSGFLQISWQTFTETNNDHFEVEVSNNGNNFTKLASVQSKALHGNSSSLIQYQYSVPVKQLVFALLPFLLASLSLGFKKSRQKLSVIITAFAVIIIIHSCQKADTVNINHNEKLFVRIAQVDVNGAKAYSKIVQVVQE